MNLMSFDQNSSKNGFLISTLLFTLAVAGVSGWSRVTPEELFLVLEAVDVREFLGRLTNFINFWVIFDQNSSKISDLSRFFILTLLFTLAVADVSDRSRVTPEEPFFKFLGRLTNFREGTTPGS